MLQANVAEQTMLQNKLCLTIMGQFLFYGVMFSFNNHPHYLYFSFHFNSSKNFDVIVYAVHFETSDIVTFAKPDKSLTYMATYFY